MEKQPELRRGSLRCVLAWLLAGVGGATPVLAQVQGGGGAGLQVADAGPRFLAVGGERGGVERDVRNAAVFVRRIAVDIHEMALGKALGVVAQQGGLNLTVSPGVVDVDAKVSFSASNITVGGALTALLYGTGVDVRLASDGVSAAIVPRPGVKGDDAGARARPGAGGVIRGSVTDSATKETVPGVLVQLIETGQQGRSNGEGEYTIPGVASGVYHVKALRVGFIVKTRTVEVRDGATSTLNFALNKPATVLNEVVTTGIGDQRRVTLGNEISSINVDSLVPTAPVTSVTDVLTSRVPGLQVIETGGLTGSGEAIRIWGQSSALLQSDPIIIVDGVRYDNTPGGTLSGGSNSFSGPFPTPSRLNDIDFSQIESIDVLKGPAAATEYGTDAAFGVIVIKTKRAAAGKPQWHASVEDGTTTIPNVYPDLWYSYGHLTNGSLATVQCPLIAGGTGTQASNGSCVVDSVFHDSPLDHALTSVYGTGSRQKYDLDVGGGTDAARYFLAGGLSNETGAVRVPSVFVPTVEQVGFPRSVLNPNSENQRSGRATTVFDLGSKAEITASAAYLSTYQTDPDVGGGIELSIVQQCGALVQIPENYGYCGTVNQLVYQTVSQQSNRFTGGLTGTWRPLPWLQGFADAGVDHGTQSLTQVEWPQIGALENAAGNHGAYGLSEGSIDIYSADARAVATGSLTNAIRSVTTVGGNLRDTRTSGFSAGVSGLTVENLTLAGAASPTVNQSGTRSGALGGYGEEQLQFLDRLFVTGAVRADGASGFGGSYQVATYPKASLSWLAIQHGPTTVRLRGAYGGSGVQPYNGLKLPLYGSRAVVTTGGTVSGAYMTQPGNPALRPERSTEWEGGTDIGLWANRVNLTFTAYQKTTTDALYAENAGGDAGGFTEVINIGEVRNSGLEASLTAGILQTSAVNWTVAANFSVNHNLLVHLAPGLQPLRLNGGVQYLKPGYPLYGYWGNDYTYSDLNHDGIIEANEVILSPTASYRGSSLPTQQAAFSTHVAVFHSTLSFGAVATYQGGYLVYDQYALQRDRSGTSEAENVPGPASLPDQARYLAYVKNNFTPSSGYFVDGTVWRLQELSATYALPASWAHAVRMQNLSLTAAARNVAFWTPYRDGDPSASYSSGASSPTGVSNQFTLNNDIRASSPQAVPLARYYQLRLNVGF